MISAEMLPRGAVTRKLLLAARSSQVLTTGSYLDSEM